MNAPETYMAVTVTYIPAIKKLPSMMVNAKVRSGLPMRRAKRFWRTWLR